MESSYSLKKLRELAGNEVNIYTNENSTESLTNIRKNASFERQSDVNDIGELIIATTKYPTAIIPEDNVKTLLCIFGISIGVIALIFLLLCLWEFLCKLLTPFQRSDQNDQDLIIDEESANSFESPSAIDIPGSSAEEQRRLMEANEKLLDNPLDLSSESPETSSQLSESFSEDLQETLTVQSDLDLHTD